MSLAGAAAVLGAQDAVDLLPGILGALSHKKTRDFGAQASGGFEGFNPGFGVWHRVRSGVVGFRAWVFKPWGGGWGGRRPKKQNPGGLRAYKDVGVPFEVP